MWVVYFLKKSAHVAVFGSCRHRAMRPGLVCSRPVVLAGILIATGLEALLVSSRDGDRSKKRAMYVAEQIERGYRRNLHSGVCNSSRNGYL